MHRICLGMNVCIVFINKKFLIWLSLVFFSCYLAHALQCFHVVLQYIVVKFILRGLQGGGCCCLLGWFSIGFMVCWFNAKYLLDDNIV